MLRRNSIALSLCVALAACAGTDFKWEAVQQITPGMTPDQVVQLVGKPQVVSSTSYGLVYAWSHVNVLTHDTRTLSVVFKDGKVVSAPSTMRTGEN